MLSDPRKRAEYDARGFAGVAGFSQQDLFGGIDFEDLFGGLNFDFGGPFEGLFRRRGQHAGPRHGSNIEVELFVSLERVAQGGEEQVRLAHPAACAACHGTGGQDGAPPRTCPACGGSGHITHSRREQQDHVLIQQITVCPTCHGRGSVIEHPCPVCRGTGEVAREESLSVKIPAGIEEGMALRIPGKGMPSPDPGGPPGDLFVVVYSRHDPRFQRAAADLLRQENIALVDAVLGTTLQVPTLDGSASVAVPPGTQPDAMLRLKGKGLPLFGNEGKGRRGDLYLRIAVRVPERLSREERELYERLRALGSQLR